MAPNLTPPDRAPLRRLAAQLAEHWEAHDTVSPSAMANLLECVDFPTMTHEGRLALVGAYRGLLAVLTDHCAIGEIAALDDRLVESLHASKREVAEKAAADELERLSVEDPCRYRTALAILADLAAGATTGTGGSL